MARGQLPTGKSLPCTRSLALGAFRQKVSGAAINLGEIKRDASGSNGNGNGSGSGSGSRVSTSAVRQVEFAHITKLGFLSITPLTSKSAPHLSCSTAAPRPQGAEAGVLSRQ
ncbi:hypothetical protein PG988_010434 [Apiospora saccharicola]